MPINVSNKDALGKSRESLFSVILAKAGSAFLKTGKIPGPRFSNGVNDSYESIKQQLTQNEDNPSPIHCFGSNFDSSAARDFL